MLLEADKLYQGTSQINLGTGPGVAIRHWLYTLIYVRRIIDNRERIFALYYLWWDTWLILKIFTLVRICLTCRGESCPENVPGLCLAYSLSHTDKFITGF